MRVDKRESLHETFLNSRFPVKREQELHESLDESCLSDLSIVESGLSLSFF